MYGIGHSSPMVQGPETTECIAAAITLTTAATYRRQVAASIVLITAVVIPSDYAAVYSSNSHIPPIPGLT